MLLNKKSEVALAELERLRQIIMNLNHGARIIEADYAQIDLDEIINTHSFEYGSTEGAAGWVRELERLTTEEEDAEAKRHHGDDEHHHEEEEHDHDHDHDEHDHHHDEHGHHHHHHAEGGEVEEYGIGTFVYYRRQPLDIDKFDHFVNFEWPKSVIRAKGVCYFADDQDMSYLFEQSGVQVKLSEAGQWYATMPEDELIEMMRRDAGLVHDWDEEYGDRMEKIVFIGQNMDKEDICRKLDACLAD